MPYESSEPTATGGRCGRSSEPTATQPVVFCDEKTESEKNTYTPIYDLKETRDLELKWLKIQEWVRTSAGMTNNNNHQQGFGSFS